MKVYCYKSTWLRYSRRICLANFEVFQIWYRYTSTNSLVRGSWNFLIIKMHLKCWPLFCPVFCYFFLFPNKKEWFILIAGCDRRTGFRTARLPVRERWGDANVEQARYGDEENAGQFSMQCEWANEMEIDRNNNLFKSLFFSFFFLHLYKKLLQTIDKDTDIVYQSTKSHGGGIITPRDFITLRHRGTHGSYHISSGVSIHCPSIPSRKNYVRWAILKFKKYLLLIGYFWDLISHFGR